jgi:phosphatidylinositol glycan class Q protein
MNAALDTQLAFMNHFPLFALMLRAKDPWRLPGSSSSCPQPRVVYLVHTQGGIYFCVEYAPDPVLVVRVRPALFFFLGSAAHVTELRTNLCLCPLSSSSTVSRVFLGCWLFALIVVVVWLWKRLAAHYNPLRLLWYLLRGERLVAIPRESMRYFI